MEKIKMTIFDELKARGLLAQLTDEDEIKELIKLSGSVTVGETPVIRIKK